MGRPIQPALANWRYASLKPVGVVTGTVIPLAAFEVAGAIDRVEHFAGERRRFFEDRIQNIGRILEAGQFRNIVNTGKFAQNEPACRVTGLGKCSSVFLGWHGVKTLAEPVADEHSGFPTHQRAVTGGPLEREIPVRPGAF
jgi:hypothetical protein